ncbi:MAG TPA: DUF6492 family protein [Nodosilinea sp.]|nr:DUF6492 family protein [Nodosilinea sp.]
MRFSVQPTMALATPSYGPDYDRCKLLVNSVQALSQSPVRHYVIVDQREYRLFRSLASPTTEILTVESLLPPWIFRLPLVGKAWFSLKTPPIRNWVLQQLVKIALAKSIPEAATVFVDSDVAFIRPFDLTQFVRQGKTRLFRVPAYENPDFDPLYRAAYQFLGLSGDGCGWPRPNYIGNLITWRRDHTIAMCDRIEQVSGRPWLETLAGAKTLSEYILYGVFVDHLLKESSGHYYDWAPLCNEYWLPQPLDDRQLADFFAATQPENIAIMISAKAGIAPSRYAHHLDGLQPPAVALGCG